MGWVLDPWCHGRGYGREAVAAAIAWGEANIAAAEFACIIDPANAPSRALAEAAGFRETARALYRDSPILVLHRPVGRRLLRI